MFKRLWQAVRHRLVKPRPLFKRDLGLPTVRLGSAYGGWTVATNFLNDKSLVYSVGVGEDVTFDVALIERFNLTVYAFDPTPKSIAWLKKQNLPKKFKAYPYGLADFDGPTRFYAPDNPDFVSHTLIKKEQSEFPTIEVEMRRLRTLLFELGHSTPDLLKMDIEGAEYAVIDDLLTLEKLPRQLLIEFHHGIYPHLTLDDTRRAVEKLRQKGYKLFHVSETGRELHFIIV